MVVMLAGCGGRSDLSLAPVSGKVTMDDKPLAGALVRFEPTGGSPKQGWSDASGITDAEGKYNLLTGDLSIGAVVGPNRVSITMAPQAEGVDASTEGQVPAKKKTRPDTPIPAIYNTDSTLTMTVPPGGKSDANFDLKSQ